MRFKTGKAVYLPKSDFKHQVKSVSLLLFIQSQFSAFRRGPLSLIDGRTTVLAFLALRLSLV